jgi:large subunit ribosomal protein L5
MTKTATYTPALKLQYNELAPKLQKEFGLKNINQVPKIRKVVVSSGVGKAKDDKKLLEIAANTLRKITGQEPVKAQARKSIATFKIRRGMNFIGVKVTLRGDKMYEFVERLNAIVLPRVRDFHGTSANLDQGGNYNIGIKEQSIFPELTYEETTTSHGLQVTIVMDNAENHENVKTVLKELGVPFAKEAKEQKN